MNMNSSNVLKRRNSSARRQSQNYDMFPELNGVTYVNSNGLEVPWYCNAAAATRNIYSPKSRVLRRSATRPRIMLQRTSSDKKARTLNALFKESNIPGMREICHSDNYFRKLCWVIAFLALGILALHDIRLLLSEFYSYPVTVDVRLRESRKLPFPAVTVCNLNIVRYSALCNSTMNISMPLELQEKLCGFLVNQNSKNDTLDDINDIEVPNVEETKGKVTTEMPFLTTSEASKYPKRVRRQAWKPSKTGNKPNSQPVPPGTKQHGSPNGNKVPKDQEPTPSPEDIELTERQEKELQENLTTWLAVMAIRDKEQTYQLGHQFEDMVLRCTIKSTNCTHPKSFETSFTPTEGNCFTYTSKTFVKHGANLKREETSLAGVDHGLELVLNLQVNEYLPGTAQIGALVMVHSPDDFGTYASEAIFIAPEKATYIGLKMVRITRLPAPYPEKCIDEWPKSLTGSLTQNSTYSQQSCLKICLQRTIQRRCHCQSAFLAQVEVNDADLRICDTRKKHIRKCVEEVMFRPENKIENCECPPRCQVIQYEKTVSLAKWPTREDRVTFDRGVKSVNLQNVAKVIVYYQTMTLQEVTQQGAWTTAKLFSSLGGFMGMYVGFSFLSLFEVLEVLFRRAWYAWRKEKPKFRAVAKTVAFATSHKHAAVNDHISAMNEHE